MISESQAKAKYEELSQKLAATWCWKDTQRIDELYVAIHEVNTQYPANELAQKLHTLEHAIATKRTDLYHKRTRAHIRKAAAGVLGTFLGLSSLLYWYIPFEDALLEALPVLEELLEEP